MKQSGIVLLLPHGYEGNNLLYLLKEDFLHNKSSFKWGGLYIYIYTCSIMVTSSLCCGESYILYIDLPYPHYAGDVAIIQYIVYSMLIGPIYMYWI